MFRKEDISDFTIFLQECKQFPVWGIFSSWLLLVPVVHIQATKS